MASAFSFSYTSDSNTHVAFPPDNYSLMMPTTILCQQPFRHLFLHLVPRNIRKHRSPESGARRGAWNVSSLFLFLTLLLWKLWKVSTPETPERQRILESDQQKVHFRYAKVFSLDVFSSVFHLSRMKNWRWVQGILLKFCQIAFPTVHST